MKNPEILGIKLNSIIKWETNNALQDLLGNLKERMQCDSNKSGGIPDTSQVRQAIKAAMDEACRDFLQKGSE